MVTLAGTQNFSEFELHARAILGLAVKEIEHQRDGASAVILAPADVGSGQPQFHGVSSAAAHDHSDFRLFGKPSVRPFRRMGVAVAYADKGSDVHTLVEEAKRVAGCITIASSEP